MTTRRWRTRARLIASLAQTWWRRPATPTRVVLDLTRRCNLRCAMCRTWARPHRLELSAQEIGAVLGRLEQLCWLDLTGGEPFVRADLEQVFAAVVANAPQLAVLHFQTNGWFVERAVAATAALRAALPDDVELIVTVSIDGPPALHDEIRGRVGSHARAVATAVGLRGLAGVDVHVGTTLSRLNADAVEATWASLCAHVPGLPRARWHLNAMQRSAHFYDNADQDALRVPSPSPLVAHLGARGVPRDLTALMESAYLVNLAFVQRGEPSGIPCQALRSTLFLAPEGDVYPCHIYDRPLGNVRERDIVALWHDAATLAARRDIERLACGGCFSACEAYPALAGAPLQAILHTVRRGATLLHEQREHARG